jgi:peptidoglycan L-alanyl-D-glutamate endopeptidase CwlK
MPKFGTRSKTNLGQAHPELQRLFNEVIKHYDCSVICGHRGEEEQNAAYAEGRSKLKFPESKHNKSPSLAVDVVPYFSNDPHIRWEDKEKFYEFGGFVQGVAKVLGINIRWGGNWDMDDELKDQSFFDLPHFEIKE